MKGPSANLLTLATALLTVSTCTALNNGLGVTPAMGFNTWNAFNVDSASPARILREHGSSAFSSWMLSSVAIALSGLLLAACTLVRRVRIR